MYVLTLYEHMTSTT